MYVGAFKFLVDYCQHVRFFLNIPIKTTVLATVKKGEILDSLIGKINCVIRKVIKSYI